MPVEPPLDPPGSSPPSLDPFASDEMQVEASSPTLPTLNSSIFNTKDLPLPSSSDPLTCQPLSLTEISATTHRPTSQVRKRGPPSFTSGLGHINKTPRNSQEQTTGKTARMAILEARDLIIQACTLTKSHEEQSKILDLLEIFREYTEKGRLQSASTIIASQVANLETATRQIETKAKALAKAPTPSQNPNNTTSQPPTATTFAATAGNSIQKTAQPQDWTVIQKKTAKTPKPRKAALNRLILVKSATGSQTHFNPLAIRNAFNKAFADKGIEGPVVASVSRSLSQNIVVTTTSAFSADFLLEKQSIWEQVIAFKAAQKDEAWHKVAIHGIPTADFNTPEGMALVIEEIVTFNKGLNPIGTPYWLTSADKRLTQRAGSIAVAFATEQEANKAIRHRLYIAGISVRVEKLYSAAPTTQCQNCQGFGHLENYCKKTPRCRLCSEGHATEQHNCNICHTKGAKCPHLAPKCANCKETHTADTKSCDILIAIKNKTTATQQ